MARDLFREVELGTIVFPRGVVIGAGDALPALTVMLAGDLFREVELGMIVFPRGVVIGAGDALPTLLPPVPLSLASAAWTVWPVDNLRESKEKILHKKLLARKVPSGITTEFIDGRNIIAFAPKIVDEGLEIVQFRVGHCCLVFCGH